MTHIRLLFAVIFLATAPSACGDDETPADSTTSTTSTGSSRGGEEHVRATLTLQDGSTVEFDEPSQVVTTGEFIGCGAERLDGYGLSVAWKKADLTEPGTYSFGGILKPPLLIVTSPQSDGNVDLDYAASGALVVTELTYGAEGLAAGTFDDVTMPPPDADEGGRIVASVAEGSFRCVGEL